MVVCTAKSLLHTFVVKGRCVVRTEANGVIETLECFIELLALEIFSTSIVPGCTIHIYGALGAK
jgi:hypothetical protein